MSIREYLNITSQVVKIPQDVTYIVKNGGTAVTDIEITLTEEVVGAYIGTNVTLTFVDGGGSDDSLLRNRGSWIDDGFGIGMTITIANTASNDSSSYVITGIVNTRVKGDTLEFATATITAETITDDTVTIDGSIPDTDWILYEQVGAGLTKFTYIEGSGTGLRFVKSAGTGNIDIQVQS